VPVKCALHFLLDPDVRLPLVELPPDTAELVRRAMFALAGHDEEAPRLVASR
jgi:hypothetical protein